MFNSHVDQPQNHHVNENHLNSNYQSLPDPVSLLRWGNLESAFKSYLYNNLNNYYRFFPGLDSLSLLKWDGAEKVMNEYLDAVKSQLEQQEEDAVIFKLYEDELEHTANIKYSATRKRKQKDYDSGKKKAMQVLDMLEEVHLGQISEEKILNLNELHQQLILRPDAEKTITFKSQFARGYYSYFINQGEWSRLIDIPFPLSLVEPIEQRRSIKYKADLQLLKDAKKQLTPSYDDHDLYQESIPVVNANNCEHQIGSQYEQLGNESAPPAKKQKMQRTHNKFNGHQFFTPQSQKEENSIVPDHLNCTSSKCR